MATTTAAKAWPKLLQPFLSRPNLMVAAAVCVAVFMLGGPWVARPVTRWLVAWDSGVAAFVGLTLFSMIDVDHARMKRRAIAHDEGRHFILALALIAAVASVAAIIAELSAAKGQGLVHEALRVGLTAGTITLSWIFVHLVFAVHYAHVYYTAEEADGGAHQGGLDFPGDTAPDYWDFVYFAVVIGATAQTADVNIQSKEFRRLAAVHGLIAFGFNTAILATMINLAAGLF
ncbi:MAG: DUF1345 domain-containing protein [Caulobacterales bacterium]